ncbi:MAG: beta-hydroxyacyl-ACP dehydratase [Clostridiales bacterium]|jgi:3-hydroxyacyl-[acyl-carrier-protein] dehydratase|nr:beta-hydroxyacyl-ACP dehydratase [Clostridiales bacterium]
MDSEEKLSFNINDIKSCQRNRYPMLFVDKITECVPLKYAKGIKNWSFNEWFFPGHFEGSPNVPGSILLESVTQVFLMTFLCTDECRGFKALSSKMNNARFTRKIIPGERMETTAICDSFRRGIARGRADARVGGELAFSVELTIVVPDILNGFSPLKSVV